jgi:alcohol dehydrogenase
MVQLPHVPGHEFSGVVAELGQAVQKFDRGDRVTVPFVVACGRCRQCQQGDQQVCDEQAQPGFSYWGSFAEYVAVPHADTNLIRLPWSLDFVAAASLGCRFATAWRAIVDQGRLSPEDWLAVFGCGGVGLSAVMIAVARGAHVIAIDVNPDALKQAIALGAEHALNWTECGDPAHAVRDLTGGGADVAIDALGSASIVRSAIYCLKKRGRHVQVGLLVGADSEPRVPMERVISWELELLGSHGMQAHRYPELLQMIEERRLDPLRLVTQRVTLERAAELLPIMDGNGGTGITVIDRFND